jgi:hypothetical protein
MRATQVTSLRSNSSSPANAGDPFPFFEKNENWIARTSRAMTVFYL